MKLTERRPQSPNRPIPLPSPDLRVGIVGYGLAGALFHAPFVATTPGLRVAAVVTGDPERRERALREHPGVRVFAAAEHLLESAADVDVVVVASPNDTHVPLARAALAAGLHVVVDKPFATTAADGWSLIAAADAAGRTIVPFHNRRWDGDFLTVQRLVAEGTLGDVRRFESRFERWRTSPRPRWVAPDAAERGEGVVMDLGTHLIDQALVLFGAVQEVYAELHQRHPDVHVEDDAFISLTHASGVRSHLWMGTSIAHAGPRFRVLGSSCAYVKHGLDVQEDALKAGARPGGEDWGLEPIDRWGTLGTDAEHQPQRTERGTYGAFYAALVETLRDGAPPAVLPDDAVAGLEIVEAARQSAAERRIVRLGAGALEAGAEEIVT